MLEINLRLKLEKTENTKTLKKINIFLRKLKLLEMFKQP